MNFQDLVTLALRGLTRRPVRTALTVLGIIVAVASMVVFLSFGEGFRGALRNEIGNIGPDLQLTLNDGDAGAAFGGSIPEVPTSLIPQLEAAASELGISGIYPLTLTSRGGFGGDGYIIEGYPVEKRVQAIYPGLKLREGHELTAADAGKAVAVVGSKAAENGNLTVGREVRYNRENIFKVVGVYEEGGGFTDSMIFVPLDRLQAAMALPDRVGLIAVKLEDSGRARDVKKLIEERFPDLQAQTQGDILSVLDKAIAIGDAFRFGISLISLIVGGLAVANTVMMGVYERTREFGVLRAIGAQPGFIRRLVVFESILLALIGGVGGVILGYVGTVAVNFAVRGLVTFPVALVSFRLILIAMAVAALLGLISGLLPARTAGRIAITEALGRN
ncbi:MAG TPA: ABC transporter permease [Deinococcales bacterium]|nr:ABC transporter permease [Deinococcales bacterium]